MKFDLPDRLIELLESDEFNYDIHNLPFLTTVTFQDYVQFDKYLFDTSDLKFAMKIDEDRYIVSSYHLSFYGQNENPTIYLN